MHNAKNAITPRGGVAALLRRGGASRRDRGEEEENILIKMIFDKMMKEKKISWMGGRGVLLRSTLGCTCDPPLTSTGPD